MDQRIDPADCEVIEQGLHPSGADIGSVVEAVDRENRTAGLFAELAGIAA